MKVFGIFCLACILAVASSQHYNMYANGDCSGDPGSTTKFNECVKVGDKSAKVTRKGDCEKGMKMESQKYSDEKCETKDGDATETEWKGAVDKCEAQKIPGSNSSTSMIMDCSPASVKTFMPIMTAFAIVVAMFSQ